MNRIIGLAVEIVEPGRDRTDVEAAAEGEPVARGGR